MRLFEAAAPRTIWRLLFQPGAVAREFVLGRRSAHMHPLKLLVALVALLVLVLAASRYFEVFGFAGRNSEVDRMAQRVIGYANWSFSLGIVAIFLASWVAFNGRLGYNAIEHTVLAIYAQNVILAAIIVNLLPTLIWRDAVFVVAHKAAAQYYMVALKLLIIAVAYKQFFVVDLRRDWPRLVAACLLYAAFAWLLLRIYAAAVLWLIRRY